MSTEGHAVRSDPQTEICGEMTQKDIRTGYRVRVTLLKQLNGKDMYEGRLEPLGYALFVMEDGRTERTPIPWFQIESVDLA